MVNADPSAQLRLLDLQGVDTALDQLAHRRAHLPEVTELDALTERRQADEDELVRARTGAGDLARAQSKLEGDVDQVRTRVERDQQRMTGASAKEATGLQHEVESLGRRQGELEDQLLELMEQREAADSWVTVATAALEGTVAKVEATTVARDEALTEIDRVETEQRSDRGTYAGEIPAELLAMYERIRKQSGGVGAARLFRRRCEGCHLELSGTDLSVVANAAADAVLRCEECGRVLVRTAESGL